MNNVVTLGKKDIVAFIKSYNKGVESTFGLQKSLHKFAQALGYTNWFFLEPQLSDQGDQTLSPNQKSEGHRCSSQRLEFSVRLPDFETAGSLFIALTKMWVPLYEGSVPNIDNATLQETLLEKLLDGYSQDEVHMAPYFGEVMEWYDFDESVEEENVFVFSFIYSQWSEDLVKKVVDGILKPFVDDFLSKTGSEGSFEGAEIVREYEYRTHTAI